MTLYLIIISIIAVFITLHDKAAAVHRRSRVPERVLWIAALIGGALSMFITMLIIRHKTRHISFMFGLPLIIALHTLIFFIIK